MVKGVSVELFRSIGLFTAYARGLEVVTGDLDEAGRCPVIYRTALVCDPLFEPVEIYMQRTVPVTSRFVCRLPRASSGYCVLVDG